VRHNQTRCNHPWPLVGFLLVALFLGHDAFMAAEARAMPRLFMKGMHHTSSVCSISADPGARETTAPASGHPENCRIGQSALTRSDGATVGATSLASPISGSLDRGAFAPGTTRSLIWEEPYWPPGTRRALWQVYRI
jgi:hypothetical protein